MSTYGSGNTFGGSFYSEPHPERVGSPVPDEFANVNESPESATPPPYTKYAPTDDGSFAPSPMIDQEVRAAAVEPIAAPPMVSLPLIAAGLFALWLVFKGDR